MNLLLGHDETVAEWVGHLVGKPFSQPYTAIGVLDTSGTLTGGFVFNSFNGSNIELSLAGRGVAARGVWPAVLHYVFEQLKCSRLQVHTRRSNKRVTKQLAKLKLQYEGIARRFYGDEDAVCYALTIDDLPSFRARWKV